MNRRLFIFAGLSTALAGCKRSNADAGYAVYSIQADDAQRPGAPGEIPLNVKLAQAAEARTKLNVVYDPAYAALDYPGGDVADDRGVCADVVIRAYRAVGVDLQVALHEDMTANFNAYPTAWGLSRPDRNIDHRRVLNLETYFERCGDKLSDDIDVDDIQPGDLVTWRVDGRLPHIGVASTKTSSSGERLFVHNIGAGPQLEACFDAWPIVAAYRHRPWTESA